MAEEDESLNVVSKSFDPLKALYSTNVLLPNPDAPIFDNIHRYRSSLVSRAKKPPKKDSENEPGPSTNPDPPRRFLPHQEPVKSAKPKRLSRNVLTRMDEITGPLSTLRDCMERRVRIK
ncbi:hypothetical protein L9F63_002109, partial [Diploptera punctata]